MRCDCVILDKRLWRALHLYRNEPFDCIKGGEFIDHFIKYKITENFSDPWSSAEMRIWHRRFVE